MPSPAHLDKRAEDVIRGYFDFVMNDEEPERLLSEEDALGAALKAEPVYMSIKRWTPGQRLDRAMDIAFEIQSQLRQQATRLQPS